MKVLPFGTGSHNLKVRFSIINYYCATMMATLQDMIIIMYIMEIWWIESWICSDYNMSSQGMIINKKGRKWSVMLEKKPVRSKLKWNRIVVNRRSEWAASVPASEKTKEGTSTVSVVSVWVTLTDGAWGNEATSFLWLMLNLLSVYASLPSQRPL